MANENIFDLETTGVIKRTVGDKVWSYGHDGKVLLDGKTPKADELKVGLAEFRSGFKNFVEAGAISEEERDSLLNTYKAIETKLGDFKYGKDVITESEALSATLKGLKTSGGKPSADTLNKARAALVGNRGAVNLLDLDAHRVLNDRELFTDAFHGSVARLQTGRDAVIKLLESSEKDPKAAHDAAMNVFREHGTEIFDHIPKEVSEKLERGTKDVAGINLAKAKTDVVAEISTVKTNASDIFDRIAKHHGNSDSFWPRSANAKKQGEKAVSDLNDLMRKNPHLKVHIDEVLNARADSVEIKAAAGMEKVASDLSRASESFNKGAVSKVADTGKGGFFTKSADKLTEFAEKDLKGVKGLWNKRTGAGKAGIVVGAAAITAGIVATVGGHKGPGERAQAISQEPAMAGGRA